MPLYLPSLYISSMRKNADTLRRSAAWDRGHMHESGTTQEWETRRDDNNRKDAEAQVWDHAADHFKAMWEN